jgi:ATP-dependent DNA helicase RecQ
VTGSFIFYCVEPKRNTYAQLFKYLQARRDESGIIYCLSRKTVDGLAADLRTDGLSALTYHAGLDKEFAREFESFPKDADSLYPSWREKSGVA